MSALIFCKRRTMTTSTDRLPIVVLAMMVLLSCGACRGTWRFATVDGITAGTAVPQPAAPQPAVPQSPSSKSGFKTEKQWHRRLAGVPQPEIFDHRRDAGATDIHGATSSQIFPPQPTCAPLGFGGRLRSEFSEFRCNVRNDYRNYYSWLTMRDLLLGIAMASPLANTSLDDDFQGWYQRDVRSPGTDDFSEFCKTFGEGQIFIPAFAGLAVVGSIFEDRPLFEGVGQFGDRVTRGYLVGAPSMLFMQVMLGGSRPGEVTVQSRWKPFDDSNAVSGHAFIGAVPFITAAKMVENPWAKSGLYLCSTFTAWSRVNDDRHYLSQACLGWWMAYLACRAVDDTECKDRCYAFAPLATPEITGVGVVVQR